MDTYIKLKELEEDAREAITIYNTAYNIVRASRVVRDDTRDIYHKANATYNTANDAYNIANETYNAAIDALDNSCAIRDNYYSKIHCKDTCRSIK